MTGRRRAAVLASVAMLTGSCRIASTNDRSPTPRGVKSENGREQRVARTVEHDPAFSRPAFSRTLELLGIRFVFESPNRLAGNTVTVSPSGLKVSNDPFTSPANGEVIDAQIGDLNSDQSPEVYVFVRERGGNGRINVIAYGVNAKSSMSEFALPEPDLQSKEFAGYNGNDEFEVVENVLSRRFQVYTRTGGGNFRTGKTRVVQYKIKQGEATWQFYVHRFDEF